MTEGDEIVAAGDTLRGALESLVVRGLRSAGARELATLGALEDDFARVGAAHLAGRVRALVGAIRDGDAQAPAVFMRAWTSLHVFDRLITLDAAAAALAAVVGDAPAPAAPAPGAVPAVQIEERRRLPALLEDLAKAVEDVVASGLGTLSPATQEKLDVSFREASRLKLLRLGTSLRYVNEELGRFLEKSADFSAKRLAFFLNRAWLLARGMDEALREDDQATLARLLLASAQAPRPIPSLDVVCLGVLKRELQNNCSFELRLRVVTAAHGVPAGQRLVWSCVFAANPRLPSAETNLHLERKELNQLAPRVFLDGTVVTLTGIAVALSDDGSGRLILGPKVVATPGPPFTDWARFRAWDPARALARVRAHPTSPLDLPVELQEEVVVEDWALGEPVDRLEEKQRRYPLVTGQGLALASVTPLTDAGKELRAALDGYRGAARRPPLFGLMHYESGQLLFQPLAAFADGGMTQLMLADVKLSKRDLLKLIDFNT
jgi:hypothetical protein